MPRTPPKDGDTCTLPQVQSEPNIPAVLAGLQSTSNIGVRSKRQRTDCSPEVDSCPDFDRHSKNELLDTIREEIRSVLSSEIAANIKTCITGELRGIKDMLRGLENSVNFMSSEFDRMSTELDACKSANKSLHRENEDLKATVSDLAIRVNFIEQNSRQQNLEINGLPENKAENLVKTVVQLGSAVSATLKEDDILSVVRVRKLDPESKNPRAVVVRLRSTLIRDSVLVSVLQFNRTHSKEKLNTQHLGYGGAIRPIFVSEHLSPLNKRIHAETRKAAREKGYLNVWVRDG